MHESTWVPGRRLGSRRWAATALARLRCSISRLAKTRLLALLAVGLGLSLEPSSTACAAVDDGLRYLNRLRTQAGLGGFRPHAALASAAQQHARYLAQHGSPRPPNRAFSAHAQLSHRSGFSGADPATRALAAGYAHRLVRENVSLGYPNMRQAIDGLMGAIYHRLAFLDPLLDEIGIARVDRSQVFLMGRSDLRRACVAPPPQSLAEAPVDCGGKRLRRVYMDKLCEQLPAAARYTPPYQKTCPGGRRLNRHYVEALCAAPPAAALAATDGRYVDLCPGGAVLGAAWVNAFCQEPPPGAVYPYSGAYTVICEPGVAVHAEWLDAQCRAASDADRYTDSGRFHKVCRSPVAFRAEFLESQDRAQSRAAPTVVLWPPEGMGDVPPAFYEEEPDPLPDRQVAGYPLSVGFDQNRFETVKLLDFNLFLANATGWQPVTDTRLLDARRDPNALLDNYTFVLFPLRRLRWGQEYVAVVNVMLDGELRRFEWGFATRSLEAPLLRVGQGDARFTIEAQREYALLVEPLGNQAATVGEVATTRRSDTDLVVEIVDPNTLRFRVKANGCDRPQLRFPDGRKVWLVLAECAPEPPSAALSP